MADQITPIDPNIDPYGYIGLKRNPDGSVTRLPGRLPESSASSNLSNPFHLSKDIPINQSKNIWVRVFVPREAFDSSPITKLPAIIYFHGGGFILCSVATTIFDNFYTAVVTDIPAIIISVEYRLAPEHRLPAAYDDCIEVLHWIKNLNDEWLIKYADISKCFLMGTSAGGNICYQVGLRVAALVDDLKPLEIKGLVLHHPFFGGTRRSSSEFRLANDMVLPPCVADLMWELSLPIGVDRDNEFCNPMTGIKYELFNLIKTLGWKILVTGCNGDPLVDRQIELVKKLEENGVAVFGKFEQGGFHGYDLSDPSKVKTLSKVVKEFVVSSITP